MHIIPGYRLWGWVVRIWFLPYILQYKLSHVELTQSGFDGMQNHHLLS
jgi:hypothetical protein